MNTASLELSKELYELSKWRGTLYQYANVDEQTTFKRLFSSVNISDLVTTIPAYNLGYLLRNLNDISTDSDVWYHANDSSAPETVFLALEIGSFDKWRIQLQVEDDVLDSTICNADTPEDAAAKLCIELFKKGLLTK